MEIELKLKSSDMKELIDILNTLNPDPIVKDAPPKKAEPKKKAPKAEEPKKEAPKAEEPLPDYTLEAVQKAFGDLAKAGLKSDLKGLLSRHGVKKVSELPQDEYGNIMDELEELLKGID